MELLIPLLLLNIGAFSLSRLAKIESTISYLVVLMFSLDFIYFAALADKLKPATTACFVACIVLFVVYAIKTRFKTVLKDIKSYCNIHTVFGFATSMMYFFILKAKKPRLYYWDEIRIWGPSAKSTKLFDRLYSIGVNPNLHDRDYPPGNALLNYLISFFSDNFSEIMLLTAYAVFFFAVFSAASKLVEVKTKSRPLSMAVYFAFLLMPFLQNYHYIDTVGYSSISYAYGTSMVDFNVAVGFLAVLVLYFFDMKKFWYVLPAIYLVTIKKNGIFMFLLAFCIVFAFELFVGRFNMKKIKKLIFTVLLGFAVPLMAYLVWGTHLDHYERQITAGAYSLKNTSAPTDMSLTLTAAAAEKPAVINVDTEGGEQTTEEGTTPAPTPTAPPEETQSKISLIIDRLKSDRYKEIMDEMKVYFDEYEEIIYIKDKHLIKILLLTGIIVALFAEKKYRLPLVIVSFGLTAGCYVYNMCISYQMLFYNNEMVEYPRYMLSYYYGWVYVMLIILFVFVKNKQVLKKFIAFSIFAFALWHITDIGVDRTIIDSTDDIYIKYDHFEERIAENKAMLKEGDRVLLVWMGGYDDMLYDYSYYFLPAYCNKNSQGTKLDFTRSYRNPDTYKGEKKGYVMATAEEYTALLREYFDYVYICAEYDWDYEVSYGSLFETPIEKDTLYKVTDNEIPLQKVVCYENSI